MFKKLFKLTFVAAILWGIGSVVYFLGAEGKARTLLHPALGEKFSISITPFDDLFLQSESRHGSITITDKQNERRQVTIPFTAEGRFYPTSISHGSLSSLLTVTDKSTIDKIGKKTSHQKARDGISENVLKD